MHRVGGDVSCCCHCGKQYRGSSKKTNNNYHTIQRVHPGSVSEVNKNNNSERFTPPAEVYGSFIYNSQDTETVQVSINRRTDIQMRGVWVCRYTHRHTHSHTRERCSAITQNKVCHLQQHGRTHRISCLEEKVRQRQALYLFTCMCVLRYFSRARLLTTPWTVAHQAPLPMGLSRQEHWRGLPCPFQGHLPHPGIEPPSLMPSVLAHALCTSLATWEPLTYK